MVTQKLNGSYGLGNQFWFSEDMNRRVLLGNFLRSFGFRKAKDGFLLAECKITPSTSLGVQSFIWFHGHVSHLPFPLKKKKITCFVEKQKGIESSLICGSLPNCPLMVGAESAMRGRVSSIWSSHFLPHRCATTGRCTQKQSADLNLGTHRMWVVQGVALPLLPVLPFGLHSAKLLHHKDPWIDGNASPRLWIYPEHFGEQRAWRCRPLRGRVWEFSLTPKLASFMVQISFSHRW